MNPDPYMQEARDAGYRWAQKELREKQNRSRAAQPRRKNNRTISPKGAHR